MPLDLWEEDIEFILEYYRGLYTDGDKLALMETVVRCNEYGRAIPDWTLNALAKIFDEYLNDDEISLDKATFGDRLGRHSNPKTKAREQFQKAVGLSALKAAQMEGFKGEKALKMAEDAVGHVEKEFRLYRPGKQTNKKIDASRIDGYRKGTDLAEVVNVLFLQRFRSIINELKNNKSRR